MPIHIRYPTLVEVIEKFVSANGFAAQEKRRSDEGTCGVSMNDILLHVQSAIPGAMVSRSSVRRLFVPRKSNTIAAKEHRSLINCKVPRARNDGRTKHVDGHFCFAQIALVMEWAARHSKEVIVVSQDDMHYILVIIQSSYILSMCIFHLIVTQISVHTYHVAFLACFM